MQRIVTILLLLLLTSACTTNQTPINNEPPKKVDVITYNQTYNLTHNPITLEGDHVSTLNLSRDMTFSMCVNDCEGISLLQGTYTIEDNLLILTFPTYECTPDDECDKRGVMFEIINPKKLIIKYGLSCIAGESIFEVE